MAKIERRNLLKAGAAALTGTVLTGAAAQQAQAYDVAIVGGGLSGLMAARTLKAAGLSNIVLLEARNRVGGRTLNQDIGNGHVGEAGGTWVGPGQTTIYDLMRELEIETFPTYLKGDTIALVGGTPNRIPTTDSPIDAPEFYASMNAMARTVPLEAPWLAPRAAEWDAMTYADYLKTASLSDENRMTLETFALLTFAGRTDELSFLRVLHYIHSAGGYERLESFQGGAQQDRVVGGSQIISTRMAEALGNIVRLSTPVKAISNWQGNVCHIATERGSIAAKQVIVALSPSLASEIAFTPALPKPRSDLQLAWPRGGSGVKTHTSYRRPFWRDKGLAGLAFSPDSAINLAVDASPPDGSMGALVTLSLANATPPEKLKAEIIDIFAACFGPEARDVTGFVMQDWSRETYTLGCVPPVAPGVLTKYGAALRPGIGRVIWAGTETSLIWTGYMDGAVRAGHQAALSALHALAI